MTLLEMKQAAIAEAELLAQPDCKPVITAEFYDIVDRHRLAQIHTVSTPYSYGDVVQPAVFAGYRYRCIEAGTSDSTAPTFPTREGAGLVDGTVRWIAEGATDENVYDVRAIAHECWMVKASASSHLVTTSSGNAKIDASALQAQCRMRARDYAPLGIA